MKNIYKLLEKIFLLTKKKRKIEYQFTRIVISYDIVVEDNSNQVDHQYIHLCLYQYVLLVQFCQ
jgi:hypothetical protein